MISAGTRGTAAGSGKGAAVGGEQQAIDVLFVEGDAGQVSTAPRAHPRPSPARLVVRSQPRVRRQTSPRALRPLPVRNRRDSCPRPPALLASSKRRTTGKAVAGAVVIMEKDPHHRPEMLDRSPAPDFHARGRKVRPRPPPAASAP